MRLEELKPTIVYDSYWNFATERQEVFFNKLNGDINPLTNDEIIRKYKFTNAFRASDRVSQYLIKNVIYNGQHYSAEDLIFRILFFKLFNKIETWEYMSFELGDITYSSYNYEKYNQLLSKKIEKNERIYSAAYIMPSGKSSFGCEKKHQNNLKLLDFMISTKLSQKIANSKNLNEIYNLLLSYPTIGSFLAFQYAIDINYSELCDFSEMSFVVAGPGAKNGIAKCFENCGHHKYEDIIRFVTERQTEEFSKRGLEFRNLFGRDLQLIDCQNLFCEVDKYSRIAFPNISGLNDRKRIKQQYINRNLDKINYFYPQSGD